MLEMPADVADDADNFAVVCTVNSALADRISIGKEAAREGWLTIITLGDVVVSRFEKSRPASKGIPIRRR
jgi:hypothetical protein